ncbi:hypothetical protein P3T25_003966 [Paraburkholderia sp. GAS32]
MVVEGEFIQAGGLLFRERSDRPCEVSRCMTACRTALPFDIDGCSLASPAKTQVRTGGTPFGLRPGPMLDWRIRTI